MVTAKQIEEFLGSGPIAMAGVSRNPKKFGYAAFRELKDKGLNIIPVNPHTEEINGTKVFKNVKDLPDNVTGLIVMTKKSETASVIKEARDKGIKHIWIQQMSETNDVIREFEGSGINLITGECILMHFKPGGIHKFHAALKKFFGRFPK